MQKQKFLFVALLGICGFGLITTQPAAAEESGMWESTKGVVSDTWDGTKNVASDVWDGTKNVASDVWDGTKNVASDVKDGVTGDEAPAANQDKQQENHDVYHNNNNQ